MTKHSEQSGFTLIELLVVISIIGILSAVVLAALNQARIKGNIAAIQSGLQEIQKAYAIEYSSKETYDALLPSGISGSVPGDNVNYNCYVTTGSSGVSEKNYCKVYATPGCNSLFAPGQANAMCTSIVSKGAYFYFGAIDGGNSGSIPTGFFGLSAKYPSNSSQYFCVKDTSGAVVLQSITPEANCLDKNQW